MLTDGALLGEVTWYRDPNPAMEECFRSGVRGPLSVEANLARDLLQAQVAKRTGALASSIHASVDFETVYKGEPRLVGVVTMGDGLDYGLPYEFGRGAHPNSRDDVSDAKAHRDINTVLDQLAAY